MSRQNRTGDGGYGNIKAEDSKAEDNRAEGSSAEDGPGPLTK